MRSVVDYVINKLNTASLLKYSEEARIVDFVINLVDSTCVTKEIVKELISSFSTRDDVEITIVNDVDVCIQLSRKTNIDLLDWDIVNGDPLSLKFHIYKNISEDNIISIYCYSEFCDALENKGILNIMKIFSRMLNDREELYFEVQDQDICFMTKSICFIGNGSTDICHNNSRKECIALVRENANFRNDLMYSLLPSDFSFQLSGSGNKLEKCFAKIQTLLAICYIANNAEIIDEEKVEIKISGQRNIVMEIKIEDLICNREIVKIYNWIYEGGNTTDKAIIARNIISLHCRYSNIINLDGKTFSSIQSNFNLYQKDNVDRYLNLKNEVGKSVTEIIEKSSELAFRIPNGIKNNMLAVFSFLFTVILANIVSDAPLDNIFTRDITVIFEVIIFFSILFLIFSVYETNYKIHQMQMGFEKLKNNYKDVFDEEELREILEENRFKQDIIGKIKNRRNWAIAIWIALLLIIVVVLEAISCDSTAEWIVNLFVKLKEIKK